MFKYKILIFLVSTLLLISLIQCAPMNKDEGMIFLQTYGYMSNDTSDDADFEKSLHEFQDTFSLPATGKLDTATIEQMERPRCGHPDKLRFRNNQPIWNKQKITYKFKNYPRNGLSRSVARNEIRKAFRVWSQHIPLQFEEKLEGRVDIDINFNARGDGPGKTLAYAYFPRVGDIYFDNEQWTANVNRGFNLLLVAAHEIGHSLGLEHSNVRNALLYPYIGSYNPNLRLHNDDRRRIQNLYGRRATATELTDICDADKIDSAIFSKKEQAVYLIKDSYCWKIKDNKVESGYPKEISEIWKDSPASIDAAYSSGNSIYFHEGNNIWEYNGEMKKSSKTIETNIDAGLTYGDRTYVFKGSNYWRYDKMEKISGYPKTISSYWTGVPNSVDAVYYEDTTPNKYFYFFKGTQVYKFDMNDKNMKSEMTLRQYLSC